MNNGLPFALTMGVLAFLLGVIWGGPLVEVLRRLIAAVPYKIHTILTDNGIQCQ